MTLEPVKIPQNVYVEDRIIGPVTLKQLIIVGIGCGVSYAMYSLAVQTGSIGIPLTIALWIPGALSFAVAFVKINDLSLFHILLLTIEHWNKPSTRVWVAHPGISINIVTRPLKNPAEETGKSAADPSTQLAEMTRQLKRQQEELDQLIQPTSSASQTRQGTTTATAHEQAGDETPPVATVSSLPVNPDRIEASPREAGAEMDSLSAYQHLFPSP